MNSERLLKIERLALTVVMENNRERRKMHIKMSHVPGSFEGKGASPYGDITRDRTTGCEDYRNNVVAASAYSRGCRVRCEVWVE